MKRNLTILIFCFFIYNYCKAQVLNNVNGTSAQVVDYTDIKGSPYLYDEWSVGTVNMNNGTTAKHLSIKFNLLDNKLLFEGANHETLAFADAVKEFYIQSRSQNSRELENLIFRNGYQNIPGINADTYLEVLCSGKVQLLEKLSKHIQIESVYPNTSTNKFFSESKAFFIFKNGQGALIKKDKKSILSALSDKQTDIENFIKSNHLNFKDEEDLIKVVKFYNSL